MLKDILEEKENTLKLKGEDSYILITNNKVYIKDRRYSNVYEYDINKYNNFSKRYLIDENKKLNIFLAETDVCIVSKDDRKFELKLKKDLLGEEFTLFNEINNYIEKKINKNKSINSCSF